MPVLDQALALETVWCVIPVYNNGGTIREVALACRQFVSNVLVVDDGSTDTDVPALFTGTGVEVIRHDQNRGKGKALATALAYVAEHGATYMITLDGDGQHRAEDLEKFLPLLQQDEDSLIIGCRDFSRPNIPGSSRFGREFANFWLRVETGVSIRDCQSGFRAYPVKHFTALGIQGAHYDFETEALACAAWAGLSLKMVDVDVWYPEPEKRISSFRPFVDNLRLSWMHTRLVLRHLLPWPHKKLVKGEEKKWDLSFFRHPIRFLKKLLDENASPGGLAAAAAVGIILATLPLIFTHTIAILYVTARLHLNKIMAVSIQNLCNPPFVPFLCIELGYFMQHGRWLTHIEPEAFLGQVPALLWSWLLGSLILAPVLAAMVGFAVYAIARGIRDRRQSEGAASPDPVSRRKIPAKRRGNALGIWFFEILLRFSGLKGAYLLLNFVAAHYLLFDRQAVQSALPYLGRRFPAAGALQLRWHAYRLFISQGKQLVDRYAIAHKPDLFRYKEVNTPETLQALQESSKGLVLLMSHVGNWQVALRQMGHLKKEIHIVMRPEDNPAIRDSLRLGQEAKPVHLINPEEEFGGVIEIMEALRAGGVVCIMGDRSYEFDTVDVPFLGGMARFPYGAFAVAAAVQCPVVPLVTYKVTDRDYIADFSTLWRPVYTEAKSKKEQLRPWVRGYAELLERFVEEHPYECFLFHNLWKEEKEQK